MMEFFKLIMLCYNIELMLCKLGVYVFGKSYRIKIGICKRNAAALCRNTDKAYVKVCIMGNKKAVACKFHKCLESFLFLGLTFHILVCNGGEVSDFFGNLALGVNEHIKLVYNFATLDLYRADFDNLAGAV